MTGDQAHRAAALLLDHWCNASRLAGLPDDLRPATRAEGYAIQSAAVPLQGSTTFGWKIAATSLAGQRHINVDGPLAGRLFADRVMPEGSTIPLAGNAMRVAELEFAYRMARDLPPRAAPYSRSEVMAAVGDLHPAIEIPDSRYRDFTIVAAPQLIADQACAHLFMLGPRVTADWRAHDLAVWPIAATVNGSARHEGIGSNALGGPELALTWLANELSDHGIGLRAGDVVTTGTCVTPVAIAPGDALHADFGAFGAMSARFV